MQRLIILCLKLFKAVIQKMNQPADFIISCFVYYANGVDIKSFKNIGCPLVNVALGGQCIIGNNFRSNNRELSNPIGRFKRCSIIVGKYGRLIIGDNVGMSSTAIVCHEFIQIGNNVNIGGNVVIYDTDFHSLKPKDRLDRNVDKTNTKTKPISIGDNVFIGAHSTILKGVTIGDNSIVGACSVVTRSIPDNEIWAGNPAKFIRSI